MKKPRNSHFCVAPFGHLADQVGERERARCRWSTYSPITDGQHEQAADQRVQEELHRRVLAARAAEAADDEVHRDQHRLEEHVEQEDVGRREDADHEELEQQQQREVRPARCAAWLVELLGVGLAVEACSRTPGSRRHQDDRHRDQHQRDAVDAEGEVHAEGRDPGPAARRTGTAARRAGVERDAEHDDVDDDRSARTPSATYLASVASRLRQREHDQRADQREQQRRSDVHQQRSTRCVRGVMRTSPPAARPATATAPPSIDSA